MDQEKIGKFIAKKRKEKKLTQQELAEKLNVTDKSVSNWENGKHMPDLSLFKQICDELDITINELLSGEDIKKEDYQQKLEENIVNMMIVKKEMIKKIKKIILTIFSIIILVLAFIIFINVYSIKAKFDKNITKCELKDGKLIHIMYNSNVNAPNYYTRIINNNKYVIFDYYVYLTDKKESDNDFEFAVKQDLTEVSQSYYIAYDDKIDNYNNVFIYYSKDKVNKLKNISDDKFLKKVSYMQQICNLNEFKS